MSLKLSQIASGGLVQPSTDTLVAVRSGAADVLVTPGTAASRAASDVTQAAVASVSGVTTIGHVAEFSDASGTITDGGVLGTAAAQAASSITGTVAAVSGATVAGHIPTFTDTAGTITNSSATLASFQTALTLTTTGTNGVSTLSSGALNIPNYSAVTATSSSLGVVKPDNSTITISGGVISAASSAPGFVAGSGTASAAGSNAVALGGGTTAAGNNAIAIGGDSSNPAHATGNSSISIGFDSSVATGATNGVAIGAGATVANAGSVMVGIGMTDAGANDIKLGNSAWTVWVNGATGLLTIPTNGVLIATSAALTDGSASNAATLTNAPTAGNPTKWIPIHDNGTTRYIPAW